MEIDRVDIVGPTHENKVNGLQGPASKSRMSDRAKNWPNE